MKKLILIPIFVFVLLSLVFACSDTETSNDGWIQGSTTSDVGRVYDDYCVSPTVLKVFFCQSSGYYGVGAKTLPPPVNYECVGGRWSKLGASDKTVFCLSKMFTDGICIRRINDCNFGETLYNDEYQCMSDGGTPYCDDACMNKLNEDSYEERKFNLFGGVGFTLGDQISDVFKGVFNGLFHGVPSFVLWLVFGLIIFLILRFLFPRIFKRIF